MRVHGKYYALLSMLSTSFLTGCGLFASLQQELCERGSVETEMAGSGVVEMCNRFSQGNPVEECCIFTGRVTTAYSACKVINGSNVTMTTRTWIDGSTGQFGNGVIGGVLHVDRQSAQTSNGQPEAVERSIVFHPLGASSESASSAGITYNVKNAIASPINQLNCGGEGCVVSDYTVTIFPPAPIPASNGEGSAYECPTNVKLTQRILPF